jgi:hypothetical protein
MKAAQVYQIGIITYKNYEERVIMNDSFDVKELQHIADNDPHFISFHIDGQPDKKLVTVKKNVEILGTTYNAFADKPLTHKTKTTWVLNTGGSFTKKSDAYSYADSINKKLFS